MQIPEIFKKCEALTMSKRQDYTTNPDVDNHENFKRSAEIASWFKSDEDKPYVILIGIKLARLGSLLSSKRTPNNESIEDSFLDLINYCALWMESRSIAKHDDTSNTMPNPHSVICSNCKSLYIFNSNKYINNIWGNKLYVCDKCYNMHKKIILNSSS